MKNCIDLTARKLNMSKANVVNTSMVSFEDIPYEILLLIMAENCETYNLMIRAVPLLSRFALEYPEKFLAIQESFKTVHKDNGEYDGDVIVSTKICGKLHSFNDEPASVLYTDGILKSKSWYTYGNLDRQNGLPAYVNYMYHPKWYDDDEDEVCEIIEERYYTSGKLNSFQGKPSIIKYSQDKIVSLEWHKSGFIDRDTGPAVIHLNCMYLSLIGKRELKKSKSKIWYHKGVPVKEIRIAKSGEKMMVFYDRNGLVGKKRVPAIVCHDKHGQIIESHWVEEGRHTKHVEVVSSKNNRSKMVRWEFPKYKEFSTLRHLLVPSGLAKNVEYGHTGISYKGVLIKTAYVKYINERTGVEITLVLDGFAGTAKNEIRTLKKWLREKTIGKPVSLKPSSEWSGWKNDGSAYFVLPELV